MTQTIGSCINCEKSGEIYSLVHQNRVWRVCGECFNLIFHHYAGKGAKIFSAWAILNFNIETAEGIAVDIFGEEAKEHFKFSDELMPMFTYGILKYPNNILNEGGQDIVENATVKGHVMYATSGRGFPVTEVTGNESDVIYGTFFRVPARQVLTNYDLTEGYSPINDKEENMYNREIVKVTLPDGQIVDANMYIANPDWFASDMIEDYRIVTGNFDHRGTHVAHILKRDGEM